LGGPEFVARHSSFRVLDGVILVAATAAGLAWCVHYTSVFPHRPELARVDDVHLFGPELGPKMTVMENLRWIFRYSTFFLFNWTWAFVAIAVIRPRRTVGRAFRGPGSAASIAALAAFALVFAETLAQWRRWKGLAESFPEFNVLDQTATDCGPVVGGSIVVVWLVMLASRSFRPAAGLSEVLALVVSFGWLLLLVEASVNTLVAKLLGM
jgi:hypothetical protein